MKSNEKKQNEGEAEHLELRVRIPSRILNEKVTPFVLEYSTLSSGDVVKIEKDKDHVVCTVLVKPVANGMQS